MTRQLITQVLPLVLWCSNLSALSAEKTPAPGRQALVVHAFRRAENLADEDLAGQSAKSFANGPRFFAKELLRNRWEVQLWQTEFPGNPQPPAEQRPTENNIQEFMKALKLLGAEDQAIVVLVGHIIILEDDGKQIIYFCPQDAIYENVRKKGDVKAGNHLIPLQDIYSSLKNCPARRKLLVLVTALSNSYSAEKYKPPLCARLPKLPAPPDGLCVWTSCAEGEFTSSRAEYMEFLSNGLEGKRADGAEKGITRDGAVTCGELFHYTREKVEKEGQSFAEWSFPQHPSLLGTMPRDWVLAGRPAGTRWNPLPLPFTEKEAKKGQEDIARALKMGSPFVTSTLGLKMAVVPPGEYKMGSDKGHDDERPRPTIHLPRPFLMGVHEITQAQYEKAVGDNPSAYRAAEDLSAFPVESVTFKQAVLFCNALSEREKLKPYYHLLQPRKDERTGKVVDFFDYAPTGGPGYRLPTEAEWEWACRAGTVTAFHFGDSLSGKDANVDDNRPDGVKEGAYLGRPAKVGSYAPNAFGLYDMHGNVAERVEESYDPKRYKVLSASVTDGSGGIGYGGLARGGAWNFPPNDCRSALRLAVPTDRPLKFVGLRVARDLD